MIYSIDQIEQDARIALNENTCCMPWIEDEAQLSLSQRIRACVEEAAALAIMQAPLSKLERGHNFADASICWGKDGAGHVMLPHDFLRLIAFKMSDWKHAVFEAITPDAQPQAYALQHSSFRGLRGTPQQPVCAIVNMPEALALEFYSCADKRAKIDFAHYAPAPKLDESGHIDLPSMLHPEIIKNITNNLKE